MHQHLQDFSQWLDESGHARHLRVDTLWVEPTRLSLYLQIRDFKAWNEYKTTYETENQSSLSRAIAKRFIFLMELPPEAIDIQYSVADTPNLVGQRTQANEGDGYAVLLTEGLIENQSSAKMLERGVWVNPTTASA
ncbi:MAG: hypothetical protein HC880_11815 [Bacteroidia bacterium]|nr:hypothetical protein [Bacteroidia bacterium]